jgi:hypothetical protein
VGHTAKWYVLLNIERNTICALVQIFKMALQENSAIGADAVGRGTPGRFRGFEIPDLAELFVCGTEFASKPI